MTMNGAVIPVLAMFIVAGEEQGVPASSSAAPSRTTSSKSSWCATPTSTRPSPACGSWPTSSSSRRPEMPKFNSISISGYHMQEAGATADQELAFTIADGLEYVRSRRWRKGLDVDAFAGRLSFFFAIGMNFFMEVAKLRAARLLWHRVMSQFEPKKPAVPDAAHALPDLGRVAHRAGSLQQRRAHGRRGAWPRCSAARSRLHTNAFDEAIGLPTEFSARIARNTQLILAEETGITHVVDPLGGSYYVEALTDELADKAWALIEEVEALGGMTKAVESGMPKLRIEESAARRQARVDRGDEVVVGVNKYVVENPEMVDVLDIDNTKVREDQIAQLARIRADARRRGVRGRARRAHRRGPLDGGNLLDARRRRRPGAGHRRRDLRRDGSGLRPPPRRDPDASAACTASAYEGDDDFAAIQQGDRRLRRGRRAAAPACWSSSSARTATTAAPRSSPPRSPTSASTSTSARSSRPRPKPPVTPSRTTCTSSACRARPPATRRSSRSWSRSSKAAGAGDVVVVVGGVIPPQDYDFLYAHGAAGDLRPGHEHPAGRPATILAMIRERNDRPRDRPALASHRRRRASPAAADDRGNWVVLRPTTRPRTRGYTLFRDGYARSGHRRRLADRRATATSPTCSRPKLAGGAAAAHALDRLRGMRQYGPRTARPCARTCWCCGPLDD